jgi:hypothetical protein
MTTIEQASEHVPEVIRRLRQVSGVNDGHIGEAIGHTRQVANMRLHEKTKWHYDEIFALADFFGVPIELMFMEPKEAVKLAVNEYDVPSLRFRLGGATSSYADEGADQEQRAA